MNKIKLSKGEIMFKALMATFTIIVAIYFMSTCSMVNKRSLESVAETSWLTRSNKTLEFRLDKATLTTPEEIITFNFKEKEGYVFGYIDDIVKFEFTNYGDTLFCSTLNEMFYNEDYL